MHRNHRLPAVVYKLAELLNGMNEKSRALTGHKVLSVSKEGEITHCPHWLCAL
ncbi:MAG: hypothetical protein R3C61_11770 [Bacteroidia bacterium]